MTPPRAVLAAALCVVCAALVPVSELTISAPDGGLLLSAAMPFGAPFTTRYIHSVQLTPVTDEYRLLGGELWGWEERVMSHNAGLPAVAPERGRFIVSGDVMVVRGASLRAREIAHRVGTAELGRSVWTLAPYGDIPAFELWPGRRLIIGARAAPLWLAARLWPADR